MGQRLIINNITPFTSEVEQEYHITNNIYYHWSAYTADSIQELIELKNHMEAYYDDYNSKDVNPKDFFNLACLTTISGISSDDNQSIQYIKQLKPDYTNESVNRTNGLIASNDDQINKHINYADGTIDINWIFHKDGKPDFTKTTFNLWNMLNSTETQNYKDWYEKTDTDIQKIKNTKCTINLFEIPLLNVETILDQLPEEWYNPDEDRIYSHIT